MPNRVWVLRTKNHPIFTLHGSGTNNNSLPNVVVKTTCRAQCQEAGYFGCDSTFILSVNQKKLNEITNAFGFQCNQGPCVGIQHQHVVTSNTGKNRTCYFPQQLNNICDVFFVTSNQTSDCFSHKPNTIICPCLPKQQQQARVWNNNFDTQNTKEVSPPIIRSFIMNGSTPVNLNACANVSACALGTTCTDVNLSSVNVTNTSCVCNGNECLQVASPPNLIGSAGKYNCVRYTTYTSYSQNWTASICDIYVQENGTFRFTLQANLPSTTTPCRGDYTRWYLNSYLENNTLAYQSIPFIGDGTLPSQLPSQLDFVFASCTTNQGCSEVLSCGNNSECLLQPNSCLANTSLRLDIASNLSGCHIVARPLSITRCQQVQGRECLTVENSYLFTMNGKYLCIQNIGLTCVSYENLHLDRLVRGLPVTQLPSSVCQVVFFFSVCMFLLYLRNLMNPMYTLFFF